MRTAEGQQVGAIDHTAALAPLLPFQLQSGQHFESFLKLSLQSRPTEGLLILDDDLRFAASLSSLPGVDLSELRKRAMGLSAEMKRRWGTMTAHVRSNQTEAIRTATVQRDMGFTAIFLLLAQLGRCDTASRPLHGASSSGLCTPIWYFSRAGGHPIDTGKQRVIDDAYVGLQSEHSSDANKLTLCSALRPEKNSAVCICLWSTFHLGYRGMGVRWPRLA